MILTCPNCATRYAIDSEKLGSEGRLVRCGKCRHAWHQKPSENVPRWLDSLPLPSGPRSIPPGLTPLPISSESRRHRGTLVWLSIVLVLAAIVGGGWFGQERIVQAWPPALEFYRIVGLTPASVAKGLEVRNVTTKRVLEEGVQILTIEGEVVNVSSETRVVPPLRVVLSDKQRHDVQHRTFKANESKLLPGEVTKFSTTIKNPPSEATDLAVDFATDGKS